MGLPSARAGCLAPHGGFSITHTCPGLAWWEDCPAWTFPQSQRDSAASPQHSLLQLLATHTPMVPVIWL